MLPEATVKKLRAALKNGRERLSSLRRTIERSVIEAARRENLVRFVEQPDQPDDPLVVSTELSPTLFQQAASAATVEREPPFRSADGKLFFWRGERGAVEPFGVLVADNGGYCLAQMTQKSAPEVKSSSCWVGAENHYPRTALQQALVDAHDANLGWHEGMFQTPLPWRHPIADRPLELRKP